MKAASDPPDSPEFTDVPGFVSVLNRHDVRYVVIGARIWTDAVTEGLPVSPILPVELNPVPLRHQG